MDDLGKVVLSTINLFGLEIQYNPVVFFLMTYIVMAIMVIFAIKGRKQLTTIPGTLQNIFEVIYDFLKDITYGTLGEKDGKTHLPFVVTIFGFVLISNWIGILPNFFEIFGTFIAFFHSFFSSNVDLAFNSLFNIQLTVGNVPYDFLLNFPAMEEPTRSVNTDLALGLMVFFAVQIYGVKNKGFIGYIQNYYNDPFPMRGWRALFFFINPFFYLNLIGVIANVVSHSFRLFGNIFGGGMIIVIVSTLLKYFFIPVGLFAYFGLFAGLVQAFVFTMLTVTYLQQQQ